MKKIYKKLINKLYYYKDEKYIFITRTWEALLNECYLVRRNLYNFIKHNSESFDGKILDFGCGKKPYRELFKNSAEYIGLDFETKDFEFERNADYYYDGKTFPFKDSEFDNVVSFQVLEHIPNPERILFEINRVLKENGKLLLTYDFAFPEHFEPYDYYRFTQFKIKELLKDTGFEVLSITPSTSTFENICLQLNYYLSKHCKFHLLRFFSNFFINLFSIILIKILPKDYSFPEGYMVIAIKQKSGEWQFKKVIYWLHELWMRKYSYW